jgi:hypothetical protein
MASQTTLETSSTSTVALRWCTVRGWGIGAGALLHALARLLLPIGSRRLLLRPLRLEARTLGLKVRPLRQKLRAGHLYWHRRPVHLEWLVKLVRLREARPNITPRGLSREWHFPLAILLHLPDLVFNDNGLVDHVLEVGVVGVKQLELNVFILPTQEHVLLLLVCVDVVRGIPWQLNEWVEVLSHCHTTLFQVSELLPLQLHGATGHVMGAETSFNSFQVMVSTFAWVLQYVSHQLAVVP